MQELERISYSLGHTSETARTSAPEFSRVLISVPRQMSLSEGTHTGLQLGLLGSLSGMERG